MPGTDDPLTCAKCRSAYWNRPRRQRKGGPQTTVTESEPPGASAKETSVKETSVLTLSAQELLLNVDDGGVPLYVTVGLKQIAEENGLEVSDRDTPNHIIEALRALDD